MKKSNSRSRQFVSNLLFSALLVLATGSLLAKASGSISPVKARISADISNSEVTPLPGSLHPLAQPKFDAGRVSSSTKLQGMSLSFTRTQSQEAALKKLMASQQNPSSPQYHQWLTPDEFGARFGVADSDIAKTEQWLQQQGFAVDSVSRSKSMIRFSGTVGQAESAFATEIHNYTYKTSRGTVTHYAPSTVLSVPTALAGVIQSVRNLDSFRPQPHVLVNKKSRPKPAFSGSDGSLFFAPGDIATEYDIQKAYNAGFTGSGQSIAVVGQSEITVGDIEAFQNAAGLPVKDPELVLVAGTGSPAVSSGDEVESDLDLEWSGAIAKGATISLVYTGSNSNLGAFDSILYAVDNKIGNIISSSYGDCETDISPTVQTQLESAFEQAATQGQTVLSASGDDGSTDCFSDTNLTSAQQEALTIDYPGSSPNVTSVGGTEISQANSAYETQGGAYWTASNGSTDVISSVLQYIPEQAWNEDQTCLEYVNEGGFPLCSGGGGASALFPKPSYQAKLTPADGHRDVPDIALNAAIYNPGYLLCSSDQSDWDTADGQQSSCTNGFRDQASGILTAAGGTSFAAPIFAGMVAIINQQQNYTTGQGPVNPTLYSLAGSSSTYASAFHDITAGDNKCDAGSSYCNGSIGFSAATGYDQATGLGTIDLYNLAGAWPASTGPALIGTATSVTASNASPAVNASVTFTVTVSSDNGTTIPTGTVTITVDQNTPITGNAVTANGTVTYTTTFTSAGAHTVLASYSGDSTHAPSTGSATVNAVAVSSGTGTFSMAASNVTVTRGTTGASTITVTPAGGYTGTVNISLTSTSNDSALQNLCYEFSNGQGTGTVPVAGTAAATTQLQLDTNAADCVSADASRRTGKHSFRSSSHKTAAASVPASKGIKSAPASVAFAVLLLSGFLGRYAKRFRSLAGVLVLIAMGLGISACGGNNSDVISNPSTGTYTVTVTGQDSSSTTIPAVPASFTLTIQ